MDIGDIRIFVNPLSQYSIKFDTYRILRSIFQMTKVIHHATADYIAYVADFFQTIHPTTIKMGHLEPQFFHRVAH